MCHKSLFQEKEKGKQNEKEKKEQLKINKRGRKGKLKENYRHSQDVCLTCMKRCRSSSHQGIWMPHRKAKHKSEQRDTHRV